MTFAYRDTVPVATGTVSVGFTDRTLDVGDHAPAEVREAGLAAIADATGATPYLMHQVHGTEVLCVEDWGSPVWDPHVDALLTGRPGVALLARAADCVPVLLAADDGTIGAVHAGREGVRLGVVTAALDELRRRGARDVRAWVGPHICGRCYEVPAAMQESVAGRWPRTRSTTRWGTPGLDLGAGVRAQLEEQGCAVVEVSGCTLEDDAWHSHRRDGASAGRMAGVVWRAA